jgi:hypothetical protein
MTDNESRFAVATQVFSKLRRVSGHAIDAVWLMQDARYAQEVLRLMHATGDPELEQLAERLQALMAGAAAPAHDAATAREPPSPDTPADKVSEHYVGHLR